MPPIRRGVTALLGLIAEMTRTTPVRGRCVYLSERHDVRLYVDLRDWWVGYYRAPDHHYVCPLPCVVVRWPRKRASGRG